jgi:hypothetical protein
LRGLCFSLLFLLFFLSLSLSLSLALLVHHTIDSSCVNRPECKTILRLLRTCLDAAGAGHVRILPSLTNVTQADNVGFLHEGAQLVYHLPVAALMLHTVYSGDTSALTNWLATCPMADVPGSTLLNLAASHDGIGLTWCRGILTSAQVRYLSDQVIARGGNAQTRQPTSSSVEAEPWELCIASWSACRPEPNPAVHPQVLMRLHIDRFLALHTAVACLRGVPAFYFSLFVAGENDTARVEALVEAGIDPEACCLPRALNRGRFDETVWRADHANPERPQSSVLSRFQAMLRARTLCAAFHPDAPQEVAPVNSLPTTSLLLVRRGGPATNDTTVTCLTNFAAESVHFDAIQIIGLVGAAAQVGGGIVLNLLTDTPIDLRRGLDLQGYETVWLIATRLSTAVRVAQLAAAQEAEEPCVMAAKSILVGGTVPTVTDTHSPAHVLGLDTSCNAWQWRYRAVALDSDEGWSLSLVSDASPAKRRVTLVHHAETIHKLKPSTPLHPCLCFDTRLPVSEQTQLREWQATWGVGASHNPCPYFDSSLVDPPVTADGLHGCV